MTDIQGRTAFITGGGNGIGLGIARSFAREGAKLALADIDAAGLAAAKEELQKITQVETYKLDVRDRAAFLAVAEDVEAKLGPVTLLFNNAGVAGYDYISAMNPEIIDWYLGINIYGVLNGLQAFMPKMIQRGQGGYIVNTSSGAGLVSTGAGALYTTSKYAVVGLSEELRVNPEIAAAGIGVGVLCPAQVSTGILKRTTQAVPTESLPVPKEYRQYIEAAMETENQQLLNEGIPIDDVGEMVLKAVKENALFILTDRTIEEQVKARTKAVLDAMPTN